MMAPHPKMLELQPAAGSSSRVWGERIAACWRASFEGILETGRLLAEAKAALPHGDFGEMIKAQLPFKSNTAERLMAIAKDERITNAAHAPLLPPVWSTLYEITKLNDEEFEKAVSDGVISPNMERRDIAQNVKKVRRAEREAELGAAQQALPQKKYGVIVADPEWKFEPYSPQTGMDRAADNHYPTSETQKIKVRDVGSIAADDCVLFLWATNPMLRAAFEVMKAWGFSYKSNYVWGKDKAGTGYWNREKHELLLIGTRGNPPAPAPGTQRASLIMAPRGKHSAKPEIFLEMIEQYYPTLPKIELNRRGPARPGWDSWGNESETNHENATGASLAAAPVSEPASDHQPSAPQPVADAGSPSFPEIILPGMAPTFKTIAAFVDLTSAVSGRTS